VEQRRHKEARWRRPWSSAPVAMAGSSALIVRRQREGRRVSERGREMAQVLHTNAGALGHVSSKVGCELTHGGKCRASSRAFRRACGRQQRG
jgi:hypothetical protein